MRHSSFDFISAASLYRGILPPIMVEAPKRATKFAANEQYTGLYKKLFGFEKVTQSLSIMTGVSAGITEAFLIVPFELIKVRMQDKRNVSVFFLFDGNMKQGFRYYVTFSLVNITVLLILSERLSLLKVFWL